MLRGAYLRMLGGVAWEVLRAPPSAKRRFGPALPRPDPEAGLPNWRSFCEFILLEN